MNLLSHSNPTCPKPDPRDDWAWLTHQGRLYWAHWKKSAPEQPFSAVVALIQAIWEKYPDSAFHLLRNRIFTTAPLELLDQGFVQVAAKRLTPEQSRPDFPPEAEELTAVARELHQRLTDTSATLRVPAELPRYRQDRAISATLWDSQGKLLESAFNQSGNNRTLHAEVILAQRYWLKYQEAFPPGSRVVTSLQCCKMCAATLYTMAYGPRPPQEIDRSLFQVFYLEEDPGPKARQTILQLAGIEFPVGDHR